MRVRWTFFLALLCGISGASAQLAITEVLSVSREDTNILFRGVEFWELTNFGTNDVNLNGYGFRDSNPLRRLRKDPFANLVIHARESIIFYRIEPDHQVFTPENFKSWWGPSKLPSTLQCRTNDVGLSGYDGDAVWLFDAGSNLVDVVEFGPAEYGHSFTYDANTGLFGATSTEGVNGAFIADLTLDVGSPGTTTGAVPVHFLEQPRDIDADGGMSVTFGAVAGGLPRPRYQWYFEGARVSGATGASLTVSNVQSSHAGNYSVIATNGLLSAATSFVARLTVNTNPTAPTFLTAPAPVTVFYGQTAAFAVLARGYPPPTYLWQTNGRTAGVGPILEIQNVGPGLNGATVSVIVSNASGHTSASALLTVTPWPDLRFTEVMAVPTNAQQNRHFGWVELTNFDTNEVDLLGWRLAEEYSFARAVTITNSTRLAPRESLVIAERLDKARFGTWWGARRLPEDFKLYTYRGFGLDNSGGAFLLWNAAARDPHSEAVAVVTWGGSAPGISYECELLGCEANTCVFAASLFSTLGLRGAFAADEGTDIGSPGYTDIPPLKILSMTLETGSKVAITCKVIAGKAYGLRRSQSLISPEWPRTQTTNAGNNLVTFIDDTGGTSAFYRVEELP